MCVGQPGSLARSAVIISSPVASLIGEDKADPPTQTTARTSDRGFGRPGSISPQPSSPTAFPFACLFPSPLLSLSSTACLPACIASSFFPGPSIHRIVSSLERRPEEEGSKKTRNRIPRLPDGANDRPNIFEKDTAHTTPHNRNLAIAPLVPRSRPASPEFRLRVATYVLRSNHGGEQ